MADFRFASTYVGDQKRPVIVFLFSFFSAGRDAPLETILTERKEKDATIRLATDAGNAPINLSDLCC